MKIKYAIYKGKVGLYAVDYVDNMERLQDFMCRYGVKEADLPIVVNRAGGRTSFYPIPENFVEIIEIDEGKHVYTVLFEKIRTPRKMSFKAPLNKI